jgi:hypothetical protein
LEHNSAGEIHLGDKFFDLKSQITSLSLSMEKNFNKTLRSIQLGIPEVSADEK